LIFRKILHSFARVEDRARLTAAYERAELGHRLGMGSRPAIVVVDFQRGFVDPEIPGGADFSEAIAATRRLLDAARAAGVPVLFTRVAYEPAQAAEARVFIEKIPSLRFAQAGTANVELDPRLGREPAERLVTKQYASSFHGTGLGAALESDGVDSVVVCGCTTSGCVRATVVDALQHGFRPLVPEECVADIDPEPHRANLFDIDSKYGDVVPVQEVIGLIEERAVRIRSEDARPL
jgi:N-formylmaleamate deformylase